MTGGLREAKKAALARTLARIAFTQVSQHGWSITVDDIVSEAMVSRRTFSNYYTCKEAAVAADVVHRVNESLAQWDPPETGSVLGLVRSLVRHQIEYGAVGALSDLSALARAHPPLVPHVREAHWQVWEAVGGTIRGEAPATDSEAVSLVVGALFSAVSSALMGPQASGNELGAVATRTLDRLRDGLKD